MFRCAAESRKRAGGSVRVRRSMRLEARTLTFDANGWNQWGGSRVSPTSWPSPTSPATRPRFAGAIGGWHVGNEWRFAPGAGCVVMLSISQLRCASLSGAAKRRVLLGRSSASSGRFGTTQTRRACLLWLGPCDAIIGLGKWLDGQRFVDAPCMPFLRAYLRYGDD